MKLVEILASEMKEWPEGVTHLTQSNVDREIYNALDGKKESSLDSLNPRFDTSKSHSEGAYPIVTRAQWQAERDRQKGGEWKRHRAGRKQPVEGGVFVEYKLRGGVTGACPASRLAWSHMGDDTDVMQYRAISQPQAEEVEVKDTTIGTLSYKVEIDTSAATQAIDEMAAKWDQIETPFKWRDEVTELNAYIEKYTRERDALIERLASEGFSLIPPAVSVVSEFSGVDMSDWRNWKAGDIVASITNYKGQFSVGSEYEIEEVHDGRIEIVADDSGDRNGWGVDNFKFIHHP